MAPGDPDPFPTLSAQLAVYRSGAWTAGHLPAGVVRIAATAAGLAAARLPAPCRLAAGRALADRRVMAARHLQRVAGHRLTPAEARRGVDGMLVSYARYWAESLRLPSLGDEQVAAAVTCRGLEHLDAALATGTGAVAALPHLGGWDWGGRWVVATGRPATVVVEALRPPEVFEWFAALRRRAGLDVVAVGPSAGEAGLRALRDNRILCLLCDRAVGEASTVEVAFFGERTRLPAGPVTLALRTGAPLLPIAVYLEKGDGHIVDIRPPIELTRRGRFRDDVAEGTQQLAAALEGLIRAAPTQWHLLQPNWPSDRTQGQPT